MAQQKLLLNGGTNKQNKTTTSTTSTTTANIFSFMMNTFLFACRVDKTLRRRSCQVLLVSFLSD